MSSERILGACLTRGVRDFMTYPLDRATLERSLDGGNAYDS
jgi:hypothetical protein